ncbi:hypothetical protein KC347_g107 [Hortaea werneckii]|nr:hypothetical protein KC347_g107 [Hortaea werneckii]
MCCQFHLAHPVLQARRATDRRLPHRALGFAKCLSSTAPCILPISSGAFICASGAAYLRRTVSSGSSSESSPAFRDRLGESRLSLSKILQIALALSDL